MLPALKEIRERRKRLGITQQQLAKEATVSQSLITKLEAGKIDPSYGNTIKIFNALERLTTQQSQTKKAQDIQTTHIISIDATEPVINACELMAKYGYSQLPVSKGSTIIGSISETQMNAWIAKGYDVNKLKDLKVESLMEPEFPQIPETSSIETITTLLQSTSAVLTTRRGIVVGVITKADLLKII